MHLLLDCSKSIETGKMPRGPSQVKDKLVFSPMSGLLVIFNYVVENVRQICKISHSLSLDCRKMNLKEAPWGQ